MTSERTATKKRRIRGYVIRLSRDPAIPTYLAIDREGIEYAASFEPSAAHFLTRDDADEANAQPGVHGSVLPCACPEAQP